MSSKRISCSVFRELWSWGDMGDSYDRRDVVEFRILLLRQESEVKTCKEGLSE